MEKDVASVEPGGYFVYDSTKPLAQHLKRDDISYFGVPLTQMCMREYENPRLRQLLKNVVYVGALAALSNIKFSILKDLLSVQFKGKEKLVFTSTDPSSGTPASLGADDPTITGVTIDLFSNLDGASTVMTIPGAATAAPAIDRLTGPTPGNTTPCAPARAANSSTINRPRVRRMRIGRTNGLFNFVRLSPRKTRFISEIQRKST